MSLETNRWESLTQEQAAFFSTQIAAASQTVFSPTANQASITPLNAARSTIRIKEGNVDADYEGIVWPDPYAPMTYCVVIGTAHSRGLSKTAFMRVTARPDSYQVEGVALNLSHNSPSGNLYGKQHFSRHDIADQTISFLGGCFFVTAEMEAQELEKQGDSQNTASLDLISAVKLAGVEGSATARLFRSLSSLGSNLVIAGDMNEPVAYSDETYDLAATLLKRTVKGIIRDSRTGESLVLHPTTRQPVGAVFETSEGLSIIRRVATYPATIGLTAAAQPQSSSDNMLVAHYYVQAKGATLDLRAFPATNYDYDPQFLLNTLPENNPKASLDISKLPKLSTSSTFALDQRILAIMNERTILPDEKGS